MILNIVKASASWSEQKFSVAFEVEPEGRLHLDLATGEVFQNISVFQNEKGHPKVPRNPRMKALPRQTPQILTPNSPRGRKEAAMDRFNPTVELV